MDYNPYDNTPSGTIRAQRENGLDLTKQDRLRLHHIAQLEYPGERETSPLVEAWMKRIETAVEWGVLPLPAGERPYHRIDNGWPHIGRDAYRTWRATQPDAPAGSFIHHLWLDHAPAPAVPALLQSEPAPPSGEVIEAPASVTPSKQKLSIAEVVQLLSDPDPLSRDAFIKAGGKDQQYREWAPKLEKEGKRTRPKSGPRPKVPE